MIAYLLTAFLAGAATALGWCCWRDGTLGELPTDDLGTADGHRRAMAATSRAQLRARAGLEGSTDG